MGFSVDTGEWAALGYEMEAHVSTVDPRVSAGGDRLGRQLESTAKAFAPFRTGALRDSTHASIHGGGGDLEIELTADIRYAPYVEDGTDDTAPQPFIGPAFDAHQGDLDEVLLDASLDL